MAAVRTAEPRHRADRRQAGHFLELFGLGEAFGKDVGSGRILIRQKVSQGDLAAMAGIARENLSRIRQDWMDAKLISRLAGYYCLESKGSLERAADA